MLSDRVIRSSKHKRERQVSLAWKHFITFCPCLFTHLLVFGGENLQTSLSISQELFLFSKQRLSIKPTRPTLLYSTSRASIKLSAGANSIQPLSPQVPKLILAPNSGSNYGKGNFNENEAKWRIVCNDNGKKVFLALSLITNYRS